jgi:hypothetical protein
MKPIPGYTGLYATEDGRVISALRYGKPRPTPVEMRGSLNKTGYRHVSSARADADCDPRVARPGRVGRLAHTLVCLAFHGAPPTARHEVDHIDGDRTNNRPDNLRWVTHRENIANSPDHYRWPKGERHHLAKLTADAVRDIRRRRAAGEPLAPIARDYGVSRTAISRAATGRKWGHVV